MHDPIRAIIDVFWNERHQAWEGYVNMMVGHVCDCGHCGRTGLLTKGVVSTGGNKKEAFARACRSIQGFLSLVQGVPMSIITQPGSKEVEFVEDPAAENYEEDSDEEEEYEEEFEYTY